MLSDLRVRFRGALSVPCQQLAADSSSVVGPVEQSSRYSVVPHVEFPVDNAPSPGSGQRMKAEHLLVTLPAWYSCAGFCSHGKRGRHMLYRHYSSMLGSLDARDSRIASTLVALQLRSLIS